MRKDIITILVMIFLGLLFLFCVSFSLQKIQTKPTFKEEVRGYNGWVMQLTPVLEYDDTLSECEINKDKTAVSCNVQKNKGGKNE